ncbi:metal ABC transporter solute-binding protein, Zn/Mn family [Veronia nyctiphanis]|uniref:metal ABC transporter solute-binding protein, Zn/Mn family n=1 Tax=Veronia nyctiphanis TaxID=1278244 RepID=UPI001375736A|nr:zinc ABC transporter substrate-binding protein [Veronia nyctiphanis]
MGPDQALAIAKAITKQLVTVDAKNADYYHSNLQKVTKDIEVAKGEIKARLSNYTNQGYFVFHDAYGYFEEAFGLKQTGHFTVDPDRKPGAKTLVKIREALVKNQAQCVFTEPQFNDGFVKSVSKHTKTKVVALDPLGISIPKNGRYVDFLYSLGNKFTECFER